MKDYLIVGSGLTGSTLARVLSDAGKSVLVIERRNHIGGNCYTTHYKGTELIMCPYGGHIFHTNSKYVWDFASKFTEWMQYEHRVKANYMGTVYSFPPNLMTLQQLGKRCNPEAGEKEIRRILFEGYTSKQWGKPLDQVPESVIKRIPIRTTWDDRYFSDTYQALPLYGYTTMIGRMFKDVPVDLNIDYLEDQDYWNRQAKTVIFTGMIDALFKYELGRLEYRSLEFQHYLLDREDYQGCATMNYTDRLTPWTRILEWKHFWWRKVDYTLITKEVPASYNGTNDPYYPVETPENRSLFHMYEDKLPPNIITAGRLGSYRYLNMDQAIGGALSLGKRLLSTGG